MTINIEAFKQPNHVSDEIWKKHLNWLSILDEGMLTGKPPKSKRQNTTTNIDIYEHKS